MSIDGPTERQTDSGNGARYAEKIPDGIPPEWGGRYDWLLAREFNVVVDSYTDVAIDWVVNHPTKLIYERSIDAPDGPQRPHRVTFSLWVTSNEEEVLRPVFYIYVSDTVSPQTILHGSWSPEVECLGAYEDYRDIERTARELSSRVSELASPRSVSSRRGPRPETVRRADLFSKIKEQHPDWSYAKVAQEATRSAKVRVGRSETPTTYSADDVRSAYRSMRWKWSRGK